MLAWMLQNFVLCAVLAAVAALLGRWGAWGKPLNPALRHALWLIVLVKLILPPVGAWPWALRGASNAPAQSINPGTWQTMRSLWAPDDERESASPDATAASAKTTEPAVFPASDAPRLTSALPRATPVAAPAWHWTRRRLLGAGAILWLTGGILYALLQFVRIARMIALTRRAIPAPFTLHSQIDCVARRMAATAIPSRCSPDLASPCLWTLFRPMLLWPAQLSVDGSARTLIAHELAHLQRRDHWTGWLELFAGILWWWNPVYWLTCARLHETAELACDARVLAHFPRDRRAYAESLLNLCERLAGQRAPALALGVASGGKHVLERRLRSIMHTTSPARLTWPAAAMVMILGFLTLPGWSQQSTPPKLPFTLSKETTVITSPLKPDGTPDYIAFLNEKNSKGVTPENNGFRLWLEIVGTRKEDGNLAVPDIAPTLKLTGARPTAEGDPLWVPNQHFLSTRPGVTREALNDADAELVQARLELWSETDHPNVAAFLSFSEPIMGKISAAAAMPTWWMPDYSVDGHLASVLLPSLGIPREMAFAFAARATLRAASGNIKGSVDDIDTIKRLAARLSQGETLFERLVGYAISRTADDALATIARSGKLTDAQCAQFMQCIAVAPPLGSAVQSIDEMERLSLLDTVVWIASSGKEVPNVFGISDNQPGTAPRPKYFSALNSAGVNWDIVLRMVNQQFDEIVAANKIPDFAQRKLQTNALEHIPDEWKAQLDRDPSVEQQAGETREVYSRRVAQELMSVLLPSLGREEDIYREVLLTQKMAGTLLRAATIKARTGQWPASANAIAAFDLQALPADMYSAGAPVKYLLTPKGPRIYSVGRNGKDDGGVRDSATQKDDLALGARD